MVSERDVVGLGDNDMTVNTYRLDFSSVVAYISLTSDTCVPVVETIRGSLDGSKFNSIYLYAGSTAEMCKIVLSIQCRRMTQK